MENNRTILFDQLMMQLSDLQRCIATSRDAFLAKYDLSRPQLELILALKRGSRSTGELAELFSVSSSAISQMVDQLEKRKLVVRTPDPNDRRVTNISISESTRKSFKKFKKQFAVHLESKFVDIESNELERLVRILTKVNKELDKEQSGKN